MKMKLNVAAVSLLALAVSSQAFAQNNTSQPVPPATTPVAQTPPVQPTVPKPRKATGEALGSMTPFYVTIGVVVAIALASGGGGSKSSAGTTGTH